MVAVIFHFTEVTPQPPQENVKIMLPEPYTVELDPDTRTILKVFLFKNIQNIEQVRNNVLKGVWKCALVKPALIVDPFQVAVAANKAAVAEKHNSMFTRNVFTELLFNLSLTKNIVKSLCKFGIEKDSECLVCFLVTPESDVCGEIVPQINGELCPISELQRLTSEQNVNTTYKINTCEKDLPNVIVSKMVTKHFVSHDFVK